MLSSIWVFGSTDATKILFWFPHSTAIIMFSWLSPLEKHARRRTHTHAHTRTHTATATHTHTHTHAHTHTHTHTATATLRPLLTPPLSKAAADAWLVGCVYSVSRFLLKEGRPWLPEAYWPGLLWTLPFFFTAHPTAKSVRNPKPAQFTSIHESVTSASLRAPLRWAGRLCGWNPPPPYFSNSAKLFKWTFHLF